MSTAARPREDPHASEDKSNDQNNSVADAEPMEFNIDLIARLEHQALHQRSPDE